MRRGHHWHGVTICGVNYSVNGGQVAVATRVDGLAVAVVTGGRRRTLAVRVGVVGDLTQQRRTGSAGVRK